MKKDISPVAQLGDVRLPHSAHESSSIHFMPCFIIGVGLKAREYFCIGMLHLSIAFWMSNRGIENLDAKIFAVSLEGTTSKLGPVVGDGPVWDPKFAYDGLDEFHNGLLVDFDHWGCFRPLGELVDGDIEEPNLRRCREMAP
jgi:hypothetical protein